MSSKATLIRLAGGLLAVGVLSVDAVAFAINSDPGSGWVPEPQPKDSGKTAAPVAATTLCEKGEAAVFSCRMYDGGKLLSICRQKRAVIYRFGKSKKVELEFPSLSERTAPAGSHFRQVVRKWKWGELHTLVFTTKETGVTYTVIGAKGGDRAASVEVAKGSKTLGTLSCKGDGVDVEAWDLIKDVLPAREE